MPFMFALAGQTVAEKLAAIYYCAELFMYPFNTAFRRLVCQVFRPTNIALLDSWHDSS
jgi:hypothetical protein